MSERPLDVGCWMLDVGCFPLLLLLVAGCATYHPQPISPEKTAAAFDARSLTNENLRAFLETNHVAGAWPATFLGPEAAHARCVLLSTGAGRGARAMGGGAGRENHRGRTPQSHRVGSRRVTTPDTRQFSPWLVAVTLDVPIETAGKRGKRIAEAEHLSEAARWNFVGTAWQTRSQVRAALLNLYAARETESLLARQESAQSNVVRLLEGQFAVGAVSSYEVTQARVALDTTQLALTGRRRPTPSGARATGRCARPAAARAGWRAVFFCRT